jgi:hypothetical protein
MRQRIRIGLAGLGRMGRIHAASRSGDHVLCTVKLYTVKQENR